MVLFSCLFLLLMAKFLYCLSCCNGLQLDPLSFFSFLIKQIFIIRYLVGLHLQYQYLGLGCMPLIWLGLGSCGQASNMSLENKQQKEKLPSWYVRVGPNRFPLTFLSKGHHRPNQGKYRGDQLAYQSVSSIFTKKNLIFNAILKYVGKTWSIYCFFLSSNPYHCG